MKPNVKVTLPEIQAAIRARRYVAMMPVGRMVAVAVIALFPVLALGAVGASRGWWTRTVPAADTSVVVPAGATAKIGRRGHFRVSLQGPAAIDVPGDGAPIHLEAGRAEITNEGPTAAVAVETAGHRIEIEPASTVAVEAPGPAGKLRLTAVTGHRPRVDGVPQTEPAHAAEPGPTGAPGPQRVVAPIGSIAATGPAITNAAAPAPPAVEPRARPHTANAAPHANAPAVANSSSESGPSLAATPPEANAPVPAARTASDEVALVRDALERLRGEKDAAAALRLLDEYDRRFPHGLLRDEAAVTRIEALLALGRDSEALQRLEALAPALLDRSPRLRVTRGELRAAQGRCPDALVDFAVVAASQPAGELARRIERERAACNSAAPGHTGASGGNR